jgi:hypothetical protein
MPYLMVPELQGVWSLMSVEIKHACDECMYMIEECNEEDGEEVLSRYIVLDTDEMKQLSKLIKKVGF